MIRQTILAERNDVSAVIYTQITDVETECDGFLNMDRTVKFSPDEMTAVVAANQAMVQSAQHRIVLSPASPL